MQIKETLAPAENYNQDKSFSAGSSGSKEISMGRTEMDFVRNV